MKSPPAENAEQENHRPVSSFPLSPQVIEAIEGMGITRFYPPQAEAVPHVLERKNLVVAIPTASGKSLVAYIGILESFLRGGKSLYIVPLRALAAEKVEELRGFEPLGLRVGVSVGDYDSPDERMLENSDVIVATSEKADSILRHIPGWLRTLRVVVADEVHLMNDRKRGPTLEVLLSRIRQHNLQCEETGRMHPIQVIALSATVKNSHEIANWLGAAHVCSEWRPVRLREGVFFDGRVDFIEPGSEADNERRAARGKVIEKRPMPARSDPRDPHVMPLVTDIIDKGGQCLVFVNTRRATESTAMKLSGAVSGMLGTEDRSAAAEAGEKILSGSEATSMGKRLYDCFGAGVAFHHAGLTNEQRKIVERSFKEGILKCIVATPTLASGINLPARRVVIRDTTRYDDGMTRGIPVMEIKQMMGRAGRPHLDPYGEAIIMAGTFEKYEHVLERYIVGESEAVESKLGAEPALRMHILAAVASEQIQSRSELDEFVRNTFHAHQYGEFIRHADSAISYLEEHGLIKVEGPDGTGGTRETSLFDFEQGDDGGTSRGGEVFEDHGDPEDFLDTGFVTANEMALRLISSPSTSPAPPGRYRDSSFHASAFGKRTAELYIDPYSAVVIKDALDNPAGIDPTSLSYLHTIASTTDLLSLFLRSHEMERMDREFDRRMDEFFSHPFLDVNASPTNAEYEEFLSHMKTALMLEMWIEERPEDDICKKYGIGPGDLRNRVEVGEWLLYSMREIAVLRKKREDARRAGDLVLRMRYGVKEELLPLMRLKGIGRVRARTLFNAGYTGPQALRGADVRAISRLPGIGDVLAERIVEQAEGV